MADTRLVFVVGARDEGVAKTMKGVRKSLAGVSRDAKGKFAPTIRTTFKKAGNDIRAFGAKVESSFLNLRTSIVGIAGAGGLGLIAKSALEFEKGLKEISTIIDDVDKQLPVFEKSIRDVSIEFAQTQGSTIKAQYDIISAGFNTAAESALVLETSAKLATAGVADIGPTADLVTSTLKGFGLAASEAEHAADILFLTVRRGKTTIPELSNAFGKLGPQARLAGVSLEETSAAVASLTAGGLKTRESVVALNRLLAGMAAPASEAGKAIEEAGIKITEIGPDGRKAILPLVDVLKQFEGLDLATVQSFFPSIRSVKALGTLTENFAEFERNFEEFTDPAGTVGTLDEAFERASSGAGFQIEKLKVALNDLAITAGRGFIDELGGGAESFLENLDELRAKAKEFGESVGDAIRDTVAFIREHETGIKRLIVAYVALKVALGAFDLGSLFVTAIGSIRGATAALVKFTATAKGAQLASLGLKAGLVGAAIAAAAFIGHLVGPLIGEAITGLSDIRAELGKLTTEAREAADVFENEFAAALGTTTDEARRLHNEGIIVLVQDFELFDRATRKAISSAEELEAANKGLGVGKRLLSADIIQVAEDAERAAAALRDEGSGAIELTDAVKRLSQQTQLDVEILARLPEPIRDSFTEAEININSARQQLDQFRREAISARNELKAAEAGLPGLDPEEISATIALLEAQVTGLEKQEAAAVAQRQGLQREIIAGIDAESEARDAALNDEIKRNRQLAISAKQAGKQRVAAEKQALRAIAAARKKEFEEFTERTTRETERVVAELAERLEAVKAFAGDAAAAAAQTDVVLNVVFEIGEAGEQQIEEAVDEVAEKAESAAERIGQAITDGIEEGIDPAALVPDLGEAIEGISKLGETLSKRASLAAEAAIRDLNEVVNTIGETLVASGKATSEELVAILVDPYNADAWIESARRAGESTEDVRNRLEPFATLVIDTEAETERLRASFEATSMVAKQDLARSIRDLVGDFGDLDTAQLELLRSTLDGNDALQATAVRLVDAQIAASKAADAQQLLEKAVRDYVDFVSENDFGARSLKKFIDRIRGIDSELEVLRAGIINFLDKANIEDAAAAAKDLEDAFRGMVAQISGEGLVGLIRMRREAQAFAAELRSAGFPDAAEAAQDLGETVGNEIRSRMGDAAKDVGRTLGSVFVGLSKLLVGAISSLIELASDPDAVSELVTALASAVPAAIMGIAENLGTLIEGIVDAIPEIANALVEALPLIGEALAEGLPQVAQAVLAALPELITALIDAASQLIGDLVDALKDIIPELVDSLADLLPQVAEAVAGAAISISELIPTLVDSVIDLIATVVPDIIGTLLAAVPDIITNIVAGVVGLIEGLVTLLAETLPEIITTILESLPGILTSLLEGVGDIVEAILVELLPAIPDIAVSLVTSILSSIPEIVISLVTEIVGLIPVLVVSLVKSIIKLIPELIASLVIELPAIVIAFVLELIAAIPTIALQLLAGIITGLVEFFSDPGAFLQGVGEFLKEAIVAPFAEAFSGVADAFMGVADAFRATGDAWRAVFDGLRDLWAIVQDFFGGIEDFFGGIVDRVAALVDTLTLGLFDRGDDDQGLVGRAVDAIGEAVGGFVEGIGDFFGFRFGGVVPARTAQFGSVLPGMGNAPISVLAHAGEGFLRSQAVDFAGGAAGVEALNRGQVPSEISRRVRRQERRVSGAGGGGTNIVFSGGTIFAKDSARVVDDLQHRNLRSGSGRVGRLLRARFGGVPGQRE